MEKVKAIDKDVTERGAILINVLLISMLISIFIAASLVLLNEPKQYYTDNHDATQAFYNAQAGLAVGEYELNSTVNQSSSLASIINSYPLSTPVRAAGSNSSWLINIMLEQETSSKQSPGKTTITTLKFQITSIGYAGLKSDTLYSYETVTVTS